MRGIPGDKDHGSQNSAYHNSHWKKLSTKKSPTQKAKRFAQDHPCYSALSILIIIPTMYQVSTISLEICKEVSPYYPMYFFKSNIDNIL